MGSSASSGTTYIISKLLLSLFSVDLCFLFDRFLFFLFYCDSFVHKKIHFYVLVTNVLIQLLLWHLDLTETKKIDSTTQTVSSYLQ